MPGKRQAFTPHLVNRKTESNDTLKAGVFRFSVGIRLQCFVILYIFHYHNGIK